MLQFVIDFLAFHDTVKEIVKAHVIINKGQDSINETYR